jgi:hypothetical protein
MSLFLGLENREVFLLPRKKIDMGVHCLKDCHICSYLF